MRAFANILAGSGVFLVLACNSGAAPAPQSETQATASPTAGRAVALGLTERRLLDADLLDPRGREIGDVERIVRGADGAVTHLLIEIEDSIPDRYVLIPLDGLEAVRSGTDWDIKSMLTRDDLMKLPSEDKRQFPRS